MSRPPSSPLQQTNRIMATSTPNPNSISASAPPPHKTNPPVPAYQASSPSSPLHTDRALYTPIANAERTSTYQHTVPIRSGHAWLVPQGAVCRLSTPEGAQVPTLYPPRSFRKPLHFHRRRESPADGRDRWAISTSGRSRIRGNGSGPGGRGGCSGAVSALSIGGGAGCPSCGRWGRWSGIAWGGTAAMRGVGGVVICGGRGGIRMVGAPSTVLSGGLLWGVRGAR